MGNIVPFVPRVTISSSAPPYDPTNPAHRTAWESLWRFAVAERDRDRIAATVDMLDAIDGDPDDEPEEDQCEAGDDGCGYHQRGCYSAWGSLNDEDGV